MFQIGYICLPSAVISNTAQVCEESFCCLKPWTSSRQNVKKLRAQIRESSNFKDGDIRTSHTIANIYQYSYQT